MCITVDGKAEICHIDDKKETSLMLSIDEKEILKEKVYRLLWEVGMKVEN